MDNNGIPISDVIDCVQALIALANLWVLCKFSKEERERHIKERDEDAKKRKSEISDEVKRIRANTIYMYEIADRLLKTVDIHFDELNSEMNEYLNAKGSEKTNAVRNFKEKKTRIKDKVMPCVTALDKTKVSDFLNVFNDYEDQITKMIASESYVAKTKFQRTLDYTRGQLFDLLIHLNVEI